MPTVEVCLSPALIDNYDLPDKIAVVVDIVRATTIICAALENGVEHVLPVPTKEETRLKKNEGYLIVGEKDGVKIEGFDLANSPRFYFERKFAGRKMAMSTTNGTKTIHLSSIANQVVIGAFLNVSALVKWLAMQNENVVIICAGWKGKVNIEDTMFAGHLSLLLEHHYNFDPANDAVTLAKILYENTRDNMYKAVVNSCQKHRIKELNLEQDVHFCLVKDYTDIVPVLSKGVLVDVQSLG